MDYSGSTSNVGINSSLSPSIFSGGGFNGYLTRDQDQVYYQNIERFQITGTSANDNIIVGSGNDTVNGGDGVDVLTDDFSASTNNLTFDFGGTTPITPTGTSITNIERFNLTTGSGNDSITLKGMYADSLSTGAGDDTINPGRGNDNVNGGAGNDLLIVDYSGSTSNIGIYSILSPTTSSGGGFNGYFDARGGPDSISYYNIERFQITGTSTNDNIIVGSGNDTVNGGDGNDAINAGGGNDLISGVNPISINPGRGEVDTLIGGAGRDRFILGDANWIGYDDGDSNSSGISDYAFVIDFDPTNDIIQLRGSGTAYLLNVSEGHSKIYINKPGFEPDELIACLQNCTGLSLTTDCFDYISHPINTLAVSPTSIP